MVKVVVDRDGLRAVLLARADSATRATRQPAGAGLAARRPVRVPARVPAACSRRSQPTPLERAEALEQLRALEHGIRIKAVETSYDSIGVDTPDDLERVRRLLDGTTCAT